MGSAHRLLWFRETSTKGAMMRRLPSPIAFGFLIPMFCLTSAAFAETYIAAQGGVTLPQPLSNRQLTPPGWPEGTTTSNIALKTSALYGFKVGHFLRTASWAGFEAEVFTTTPHIKDQAVTTTLPPNFAFISTGTRSSTDPMPGQSFRVTTLALNEVLRYPGKHVQPYIGAGLGLFYAQKRNTIFGDSQSSFRPGVNVQGGLRVLAFEHLAFFAEWKFNYTRFHFDASGNTTGSNANYNAHHLVAGIGYHF
jgi:opacity protein-like surface antigen